MLKNASLKKKTVPAQQRAITQFFKKCDSKPQKVISSEPIVDNNLKRKAPTVPNTGLKKHKFTNNDKSPIKKNNHIESSKSEMIKDSETERTPLCVVNNTQRNVTCNKLSLKTEKDSKKTPSPKKAVVKSPIKSNELDASPLQRSPELSLKNALRRTPNKTKPPSAISLCFEDDELTCIFSDEFDNDDIDEICKEDLDLSTLQRCEIVRIVENYESKAIRVKNFINKQATCVVEGIWMDVQLSKGDIVNLVASKCEGRFVINNSEGLLVHHPDHLMSSTSIVAGVYCQRKAVLQERFRGIDCTNEAMTIGTLVHELVQKALTNKISDLRALNTEAEVLIKNSIHMLYDAGLSIDSAMTSVSAYTPSLIEFMELYLSSNSKKKLNRGKDKWNGVIDEVLDIEENLCCPKLGVKGKIDATLQVTMEESEGNKSVIVPLELKTGRSTASAEHRGQVVLYGMMLAALRNDNPANVPDVRGLLLYLKEKADLREVKCGYPERRDLVMLRNQLVQYLADTRNTYDSDDIQDIEDAANAFRQRLPEPVHNERACNSCPYLTLCSIYLWNTEGPQVLRCHPLSILKTTATGHLSPSHVEYFLNWAALVKLEEKGQTTSSPLHSLWTETPENRMLRGVCACNLKLESSKRDGDRFLHIFRNTNEVNSDKRGPQVGDYAIVSIDNRPWIAAGTVTLLRNGKLHILLERDLLRRYEKWTLYHIDIYEFYASTLQNLTNLGVLMDNNERANDLRRSIIDKQTPAFHVKLSRKVYTLGVKLMSDLNMQQQKVVLRGIAAKDYMLLQGLPGTGKTQTISVLIQMLVAMGQTVLVTAHTHSAVDTVLMRLPKSLNILRLGSSSRVAPSLVSYCEATLAAGVTTPEELAELYNSMSVVGVTCLGSSHSLLTKKTFDVCIVDEATQVLQSTVIRPLLAARRFILVGDPEQLPPVVRSQHSRKLGMEESLFMRLKECGGTFTLTQQYRMNSKITELANRVAYNGALECATDGVRDATIRIRMKQITNISKYPWLDKVCDDGIENSVIFLDTGTVKTDNNKLCSNQYEVDIVLVILQALYKGGVTPSDVGVIAPYRDQVALLRQSVSDLGTEAPEVNTVDQFQGKDKSVIIYSCTRSDRNEGREVKEAEIINDRRRLAVAVTRAKHKLVIVGDACTLRKYPTFQSVLNACSQAILVI